MLRGICDNPDCTVAATGKCLEHGDPTKCPHFHVEADDSPPAAVPTATSLPLTAPFPTHPLRQFARRFAGGNELGNDDAAVVMRARYAHLVAILGCFNAGKTCFLNSLYLLASSNRLLPDYRFAGSLTLPGFENRARLLRKWPSGPLPAKLADHTVLSDPRSPAFLHLALQYGAKFERRFDLLLTDLPGEWTEALIRRASEVERFRFLCRADGIILVIDGQSLVSEQRHVEVHRTELLLDRLAGNLQVDRAVPLVLLISKCDLLPHQRLDNVPGLCDRASRLGFTPEVVYAAAFSSRPDEVPHGTGIKDIIARVLLRPIQRQPGRENPTSGGASRFHQFRWQT
jgi:hypothetical protein